MTRFIPLMIISTLSTAALANAASSNSATTQTAPSGPTITILAGASDYTADLQKVFAKAPAGSTIRFQTGTYTVAKETTYVINNPITITGDKSTLVNVHLQAMSNISISNIAINESDCIYKSTNPSGCPVLPPMISIGADGHPITSAKIANVTMNFSRAYTGIAFGFGPVENVSITNFTITDHQLSGITALGGTNINIANGSIYGGTDANVDDGIALYAYTRELSNVSISNIKANNTFDAIGIGTLMYFPLHDVTVTQTACTETAVCIYIKAGDAAPVPSQYSGYSHLDRLKVDGVTDVDTTGKRYLSSVWIYAKGGATAADITVNNVKAATRSASASTPRIWVFTDAKSTISNTQISNINMTDRYQGAATGSKTPGSPTAEGVFLQDFGKGNISNLTLTNINMNGAAYYAVDSSLAKVQGLNISSPGFKNMNIAKPTWPLYSIPYEYVINGQASTNNAGGK